MFKKTMAALCLGLSLSFAAQAQDFDNYRLLQSSGTIPKDFLTPSSVKYKKELENINKDDKRRTKKDQAKFYLESNFLIDDLLQSGKVLFNDPITVYINKVADELLKNEPALRKKIRFYAVSSPAVNAFATNQGIIFVNMGLIAQLETEAQLAFILAHEIAHVRHKHALDMYLESRQIDRKMSRTQLLKQSSFDDRLIAKNYFSKELEMAADKLGLDLYINSSYSLKDISGVFDVLQYAYLPFDIKTFDKSFLESEQISIPDSYLLPDSEANAIGSLADDDEDDSKSTHPSISKRRTLTSTIIEANRLEPAGNKVRNSYIAGTVEQFVQLRDIARFELCYYYLDQYRYQDALNAVYLLSEKYPNSKFLHKIKVKALYGYCKFRNESAGIRDGVIYEDERINLFSMRADAYEEIEGDLQHFYYLLNTLHIHEINTLALRAVWDALAVYPNDTELQDMKEDLFLELAYLYDNTDDFSLISMDEELAKLEATIATLEQDTAATTDGEPLSKYEKIKSLKAKNGNGDSTTTNTEDGFARYAFADIVHTATFKADFEKGQQEKTRIEDNLAYYKSKKGRAQLKKENRKRGAALGIDSVLVLAPYYRRVNTVGFSKKLEVDFLYSEERQKLVGDLLVKNAQIAGMDVLMLDPERLKPEDTEQFNDLKLLMEWVSQQSRLGSSILMKGFNQEEIDRIIAKYDKRYVLFTGVMSLKQGKNYWILYTILFDLQTGRYKVLKESYYRRKDTNVMLNAHLFDTFFQIKSVRK